MSDTANKKAITPLRCEPGTGATVSLTAYSPLHFGEAGEDFFGTAQFVIRERKLQHFLPMAHRSSEKVTYSLMPNDGAGEMVGVSYPIRPMAVPLDQVDKLKAAFEDLFTHGDNPSLPPKSREIIRKFRLPSPDTHPECYRLVGTGAGSQLIILWGVEAMPGTSLPPLEAIEKLQAYSFRPTPMKSKWLITGLLLLLLVSGLVFGWYQWGDSLLASLSPTVESEPTDTPPVIDDKEETDDTFPADEPGNSDEDESQNEPGDGEPSTNMQEDLAPSFDSEGGSQEVDLGPNAGTLESPDLTPETSDLLLDESERASTGAGTPPSNDANPTGANSPPTSSPESEPPFADTPMGTGGSGLPSATKPNDPTPKARTSGSSMETEGQPSDLGAFGSMRFRLERHDEETPNPKRQQFKLWSEPVGFTVDDVDAAKWECREKNWLNEKTRTKDNNHTAKNFELYQLVILSKGTFRIAVTLRGKKLQHDIADEVTIVVNDKLEAAILVE